MNDAKEKLLALLSTGRGRFVTLATAAAAGIITRLAASAGFNLPAEVANYLAGIFALAVGWLIDMFILRVQNHGVKAIQTGLNEKPGVNLRVDGAAGPATIEAARGPTTRRLKD